MVERTGRSRAFINGRSTTLAQLRDIGEKLVDIHGQHEHQLLVRPDVQRDVLDAQGDLAGLVAEVEAAYRDWQHWHAARQALAEFEDTPGDMLRTGYPLLVRGLATMETVDGVSDEYIAAAKKSLEESQLAEFERNVRSVYKRMVRISIEPHWARFYDFGAGRLPAFLANLVNDS